MSAFTENITDSYVVADLETTGLSPAKEEIIEIAAVRVIDNKIVSTYSTLVDPCRHISREITMLTGIDDSMVKGAPHIDEAMKGFLEFTGDMTLLGHNFIRFDMKFLEVHARISNKCIDTLYMAQHMETGSAGCSLSALCNHFGIINTGAHRALSDCEANHHVYQRLKQIYKEKGAFFNMSVPCSCKKHQTNIESFCRQGDSIEAEYDAEKNKLVFFRDGNEIGAVCGEKTGIFLANRDHIRNITAGKVLMNEKGKYNLGVHMEIGENNITHKI